ncbi:hypothetical protein LTR66_011603 [Elasticomyces elasticus]|nr:hypothetical protein LTR66_011603 [Elasticomyces elasticus]
MTDPDAGIRAWYAVPGSDGFLKTIRMPQIGGANKFQRPVFGDTRLYVTDSNGNLYCLGSPVNLPLNCTSVDFGEVSIGSAKTSNVTCTAVINLNRIDGMTVGDARFEVSNATLPVGPVAQGTVFSFPVRWNLTTTVVQNTPNASYGAVTPGIKTTPLTLYTNNGVGGYATVFPLSLTGTEVSQKAYFSLSPITIDFGGLVLGIPGESPANTLSFSIANLGSHDLSISRYAYTTEEPANASAVWTYATYSNNTWDLGVGFTSSNLPAVGSVLKAGQSQTVDATFKAVNGVGPYLSYFKVYTDTGGNEFTILEGSASTGPVANFSISNGEGGWLLQTELTMDFGLVAPGATATRQIRICNSGGSVLTISKSKPPLSQIRATVPGVDLHESQTIAVNDCAYGTVAFSPNPEPPNIYDFRITDSWTLNTDDLSFGVHVVNTIGTVHDRIVGPTYSNGSFRYAYLGCYVDSPRLLPKTPYPAGSNNENGNCQTACLAAGYTFAGTEYQTQCYCGNAAPPGYMFYTEDQKKCTYSCANDATQACGGNGGYISIYYDSSKYTPNNSTYDTTPPPPPVTVQSVGNYGYIGCYSEGTNGRALAAKNVAPPSGGGGFVEWCAAGCQGYTYFGVEFSNECYCGNTLGAGSALLPGSTPSATGCSSLCGGNTTEYCGGGSKLNLYQLNAAVVSSSSSVSASASTTSSAVTSSSTVSSSTISSSTVSSSDTVSSSGTVTSGATPSSAVPSSVSSTTASSSASTTASLSTTSTTVSSSPASTTVSSSSASVTPRGPSVLPSVGSFVSIGCYNESAAGRTINAKTFANDSMTVEACGAFCAGFTYMGVEYARECYCGNAMRAGSGPASSGCTMVCKGNKYEYCGGSNRLNMYQVSTAGSSTSSSIASSSSSSAASSTSSSAASSTSSSAASSTSSSAASSTSSSAASSTPSSTVASTPSSAASSTASDTASSTSISAVSSTSSDAGASASSSGVSSVPSSSVVVSSSSSSAVSSSTSSSSGSSNTVSSSSSVSSTVSVSSSATGSSTSSSASSSATVLACPASNSTTYTTVNGTYVIECYVDHAGGDIKSTGQAAATFQTCVDRCSATTGCAAFSWVSGPKNCYLKSTLGVGKTNTGVWGGKLLPSSSSSSAVTTSTAAARRRTRALRA